MDFVFPFCTALEKLILAKVEETRYRLMSVSSYSVRKENTSIPVVQWLSYSPLDPRFASSNPAGSMDFSERKNPEYDFLRKGSKAMGSVS